jgi:hypothetical protein
LPNLTERLVERRTAARTAADDLLTRAQTEERDLSSEEVLEHARHVADEREAADELDALRDEQIVELRAAAARAVRRGLGAHPRADHAG